jgi:Protein of unknown function (DUF3309)
MPRTKDSELSQEDFGLMLCEVDHAGRLLIILILLLLGALPTWPYSGDWGYYPSGGLGLVLVVVLLLVLMGRI